jgi:hypothetical protein
MTSAPHPLQPQRWPAGWFLVASAIGFGLSLLAVWCSSRDVDRATSHVPPGQCATAKLPPIPRCRGLVLLQLAGSQESADTIVKVIRDSSAMKQAVRSVQLDYVLIPFYVAFLGIFGAAVASLKGLRDYKWVRRVLFLVASLQGVAGVLDGVENVGLFAMLAACKVQRGVAEWTFWVSWAKWWLIGVGFAAPLLAFIVWALLIRGRNSGPAGAGG